MALKLENVTLADRAEIAEIIFEANYDDPYAKTVWPTISNEDRAAGIYGRLGTTMLRCGAWFMKVTENGKVISYSQWRIPSKALEQLKHENGGGIADNVDEDTRKRFQEECDAECTADGEPKGLRLEVVEACTPASEAAKAKAFPQDEDYIMLVQVKTLPAHQKKGAGTLLTKWGVNFAQQYNLKICLEATPFGLPLYTKLGFVPKAECEVDVSRFGGPASYKWSMMVKEP